ncbi:hypothetical protein WICMUC_003961 [Wickerhamomyces mucosus]|uniref:Vacuolar protein sorting-associated protein 20 n=1 Tax=Wickerhamomyces mucosus TaxID=1378264 RepID=A0A9P8TB24_9ASCO|nr:hypothetical protein WICMUC_003961 [Wickerhamomyces mucosus]
MGNTSSSPVVTAQDKAILQLKLQKDKLTQYEKRTNNLLKSETLQIKKLLRENNKTGAKVILKKKKYQQSLLESVSNQILNLENMIQNIEFKLIEKEFLKGLTQGNSVLKKLNNELNVKDVNELIDEVNDNIEYQNEINDLLSTSIVGKDYEDEIDEELQALENEVIVKTMPDAVKTEIKENITEVKEETQKKTGVERKQKQEALLA